MSLAWLHFTVNVTIDVKSVVAVILQNTNNFSNHDTVHCIIFLFDTAQYYLKALK